MLNRDQKSEFEGVKIGNTNQSSTPILRKKQQEHQYARWIFTFNNPKESEKDFLTKFLKENCKTINKNSKIQNYVFQEETGAQGTMHLQGRFTLHKAMRFTALKKLFPTIHFESENNEDASSAYCTKALTRSGCITSGYAASNETKWILIIKNAKDTLPNFTDYYSINEKELSVWIWLCKDNAKILKKLYNTTMDELLEEYIDSYMSLYLEHTRYINSL